MGQVDTSKREKEGTERTEGRRNRGGVTILTPFSTSPMTDASVDALPTLFLAYCAIDHADSDPAD